MPSTIIAVLATLSAAFVYCFFWAVGLTFAANPTESIDPGLYLMQDRVAMVELKKGDLVSACIPAGPMAEIFKNRGYVPDSPRCSSGLAPIIKPVAALEGDFVSISEAGVFINGELIPRSKVYSTDSKGRSIEHLPLGWTKTLGPNEIFVMATRLERSLDSRYYGVLQTTDLVGKAVTKVF
jgi:conjugative transfer signal peptidase TraF